MTASQYTEDHENLLLSFKALGAGLWEYNIDTDEISCDRRWYEIVGVDSDRDPILRIDDFKRHIHPDDLDIAISVDIAEVDRLIAEDSRYHVEFRIVRPSGDVRWLRSVASLVTDSSSHHRRAVGCITDITEFRSPEGTHGGHAPTDAHVVPMATASNILSDRERECLLWVSMGKTAWETAKILGRSRRTVEFHLNNAVEKLDASNKIHAAIIAIRMGIL